MLDHRGHTTEHALARDVGADLERILDDPHPYLLKVLNEAQRTSQHSNGAFDITVQPLWALYAEAQRAGRLPFGRRGARPSCAGRQRSGRDAGGEFWPEASRS